MVIINNIWNNISILINIYVAFCFRFIIYDILFQEIYKKKMFSLLHFFYTSQINVLGVEIFNKSLEFTLFYIHVHTQIFEIIL